MPEYEPSATRAESVRAASSSVCMATTRPPRSTPSKVLEARGTGRVLPGGGHVEFGLLGVPLRARLSLVLKKSQAPPIQLKLDGLLRSIKAARNDLVSLEDLSDEELDKLRGEFARLAAS